MVWKQDLAKLKQALGPEAEAPAPKPAPKPQPKPAVPSSLEDEDAMFLSAMGLKPARAPKPKAPEPTPEKPVAAPPPPPVETFEEALKDLKGVKPLTKGPAEGAKPVKPASTRPLNKPTPAPPRKATPPPPPPPPAPEPIATGPLPQRFQLAAGMAIDVDATLDLRGHTMANAMDRLGDRLGDGLALGWRSLLVTLGPDPALHQGLLDLLASGQTPMVGRYAQAPVPMGGAQAWVLYFPIPTP